MTVQNLLKELRKHGSTERALLSQRYFKTGPGEYGEGDVFWGLTVPDVRTVAKQYVHLDLKSVNELLVHEVHEVRLVALLILVHQFQKGDEAVREKIVRFYLRNARFVNNWDLVDLSAHKILGEYLVDKNRKVLYDLVRSSNLWERRISIISTFAFIHRNDLVDSMKLAKILLFDEHDLMHKAVGWVLREVGKKDEKLLRKFLTKHGSSMPRTMLRYSIERLPDRKNILVRTRS